jgi:AhpD family alkylhydroperoxidase
MTHAAARTIIQIFLEQILGGSMETRFKYTTKAYKGMEELEAYLKESSVEEGLLHLIKLRASQVNGCAYCLDMHWKDLRAIGENEQRMYSLDAWRECPYYTDRERAALAWTEAVTKIIEGHVEDVVYEEARKHFSDRELADLTLAVATINAWNRLAIASRMEPGKYQPATVVKKTA